MNKRMDPKELAEEILKRSDCRVQVGAVLADAWGVYGWGWNHAGADGLGQHAEIHCLSRANRRRMPLSTLYVASRRKRNGRTVNSRPCGACLPVVTQWVGRVMWRDGAGIWVVWDGRRHI